MRFFALLALALAAVFSFTTATSANDKKMVQLAYFVEKLLLI